MVLLFGREKARVRNVCFVRESLLSGHAARFVFQISQEKDIGAGIVQFHENILI